MELQQKLIADIARIYPIPETAKILRVSPALIRLEIARGRLRVTRVGLRKIFIARHEIERYLAENTTRETSPLAAAER